MNIVHSTGATRSNDLDGKRFDLISGVFIKRIYAFALLNKEWMGDLCDYPLHRMIATARENIYDFLGGDRDWTLERAAYAIMFLIDEDNSMVFDEEPISFTFYYSAISALAATCDEGAKKYGEHNWLKGLMVSSSLLNHTLRHLFLYEFGDQSEPHLPHALWGLMASIHMYHTRKDMCTELYNAS